MKDDLAQLINDPRFRAYHEGLGAPEFNTFDVLRYSGYEIRHSNVLAWLLRPAGTHGIGPRFLKWFVDHVGEGLVKANAIPLPNVAYDASNVEVWRERDWVDVTIRFKKEKCVIAIENKIEAAYREHFEQAKGYEGTLRDKHKKHRVQSVLLAISPDREVTSREIAGVTVAYVGWDAVHTKLDSLLASEDGFKSSSRGVQEFVHQYQRLVGRWFRPAVNRKKLFEDHRSVLTTLRERLEKEGHDAVGDMVSGDRSEYRDALVRLVKRFGYDPIELRAAVRNRYLDGHDVEQTHGKGWCWLCWTGRELSAAVTGMGAQPNWVVWGMVFHGEGVTIDFCIMKPWRDAKSKPFVSRLMKFIETTPINRQNVREYFSAQFHDWYSVYRKTLITRDELIERSPADVQDLVIRRLDHFMTSDDSEYRRIEDYFQCLAFMASAPRQ